MLMQQVALEVCAAGRRYRWSCYGWLPVVERHDVAVSFVMDVSFETDVKNCFILLIQLTVS